MKKDLKNIYILRVLVKRKRNCVGCFRKKRELEKRTERWLILKGGQKS